jgi:hypothetical protein
MFQYISCLSAHIVNSYVLRVLKLQSCGGSVLKTSYSIGQRHVVTEV